MGVYRLSLLLAALVYNTNQYSIEIKEEDAYDYFHSLYECHSDSATCDVSPCDVIEDCLTDSEPADAYCVNNECGGCYAEIWSNATMLDCLIGDSDGCMQLVHACDFDPCNLRIGCPAYPHATCVTSFCGECRANWFVGDSPVDCFEVQETDGTATEMIPPEDSTTGSYPSEQLTTEGGVCDIEIKEEFAHSYFHSLYECEDEVLACDVNVCNVLVDRSIDVPCGTYCVNNNCGGCYAEIWTHAKYGDCWTYSNESVMVVSKECSFDPCNLRIGCPEYPQARCVRSPCGECRANWFVGDSPVDCFEVPEPTENTTEVTHPAQSST